MPNLTDTQLVILSAAAQRDDRAVLPLPTSLSINKGATTSVLKGLIKKGLVQERPARSSDEAWREGDDGDRLALSITDAGLEAIGVEPEPKGKATNSAAASKQKPNNLRKQVPEPSGTRARAKTKQSLLIDLLTRKRGATIQEAIDITGWQAHSVRGFISGTLRKRLGLNILSEKDGQGIRRYRIDQASASAS